MNILQVGFILDYVPAWLGPTLLLIGVGTVVIGFIWMSVKSTERDDTRTPSTLEYKTAFLITGAGILMLGLHTYLNHTFIFVTGALMAGRWIEGIAATKFVAKISAFFSDSSGNNNAVKSYIKKRAYRLAGVLLFLILAVWTAIYAIILGFGEGQPALQLALVWTIIVGALSLFGLMWKLREIYLIPLARLKGLEPQPLRVWVLFVMMNAMVLAIVGAQLYNFRILGVESTIQGVQLGFSALDIIVPVIGNIVYAIAFVVGIKKMY
ncbi:hypothetical protein [Salinigranum rubrum]|nr:hypothetical protein [Salinigranum rubrum]